MHTKLLYLCMGLNSYRSLNGLIDRKSLDACVASCSPSCPLVLTGNSQGGAVATAAAADLSQVYNPMLITFAAPRAIVRSGSYKCSTLKTNNIFRFVNTDRNAYDSVPNQVNVFNEKHPGWPLLLDDVNYPLMTTEFDDNKNRRRCDLGLHEFSIYQERVQNIIDRDCFPVPVSGWPDMHYCTDDDECISNFCNKNLCQTGL
jgi:Lipase (class 3)